MEFGEWSVCTGADWALCELSEPVQSPFTLSLSLSLFVSLERGPVPSFLWKEAAN